ncbi:MAG: ribosome-associated translation inhibitor RaiA [Acidobacteriota bacterium]
MRPALKHEIMQVTYTGIHHDLPEKVQNKLDAKFAKLSKLLDGNGEHKAHVVLSQQKRTYRAEVTIHYFDHQFVGIGTNTDLFLAMTAALEKLEAQALKQRNKWRETHRRQAKPASVPASEPASTPVASSGPRVFRVNMGRRKPLTLEEAMMMIDKNGNHLAYRDADTDRVSVLVRRTDGHFDLIES